ncbi:hypothetical protein [Pimelobacter simplex]|uniref:hypothetical protein n=1 Tax=Nocardioides simplex TaxID=2045 RepID=UPI003AAEAD8C
MTAIPRLVALAVLLAGLAVAVPPSVLAAPVAGAAPAPAVGLAVPAASAARPIDRRTAQRFARAWGRLADQGRWRQVRARSVGGSHGVALSEVKWYERTYGGDRYGALAGAGSCERSLWKRSAVVCYAGAGAEIHVVRVHGRLKVGAFAVLD